MNSRTITYILIVLGAISAIYAQAEKEQNTYLLIVGFAALMIGLYRLSRGISSRNAEENFVKSEKSEKEDQD